MMNLLGSHIRIKSVIQPPPDVVFGLAVSDCLSLFEPRLVNPSFDPSTADNILIAMTIQYGNMDLFNKVCSLSFAPPRPLLTS